MSHEFEVNHNSQDLINKFYEKQQAIDEQQQELYSIAKDYYANKFSILQKGNYYLTINKSGYISVYYQRDDFYLWRYKKRYYNEDDYEDTDWYDNPIEKQLRFSCNIFEIKTKGVYYKYTRSHWYFSENKTFLLFNDSNGNEVFSKYGFKKPNITRQGIIKLFDKMNETDCLTPISLEEKQNNHSKQLSIDFYKKEKSINKQQQELYFIAKQYYDIKFSKLQKGNYYLTTYWGKIDIFYQIDNFYIYRISHTFYMDRKENEYRYGDNIIERNFVFDSTLNKIITKGICDRHSARFYKFENDDNDTFILFNDSNVNEVFKKYGFKQFKINKDYITRLFLKIKQAGDLTPISVKII